MQDTSQPAITTAEAESLADIAAALGRRRLTLKAAKAIVGAGLSGPKKMPGRISYGLPTSTCKAGSRMARHPGTVCADCYAYEGPGGGSYSWPNVKAAYRRRYESLDHPQWIEAMARLISHYARKTGVFRWHDSGDFQSIEHIQRIMTVCQLTPEIRHWIPTHEATLLWQWACQGGEIPSNVTVRLSAPMVDQNAPLPQALADIGVKRSAVHTKEPPKGAFACIAPSQKGECRACRACWSPNLDTVSYHKH